jgi:hypothetical protein
MPRPTEGGQRCAVGESKPRLTTVLRPPSTPPDTNRGQAGRPSTRTHPEGLHLVVGSPGAPETQPDSAPWLPIEHAEALEATADWVPQVWRDMDTTLVAAPLGEAHTAVMLGQPGGRHSGLRRWRGWAI